MFAFKHLKKSFINNTLFEDISYDFPSFGMVMILGKSGGGKTTLLYTLTGLETKDKGSIFYGDKELKTDKDFRLFRKKCGFVFQEYGVLNYLSVNDNLNLAGFDFSLDNSLLEKKMQTKNTGTLSGGEKQRLAILRCIYRNPEIVFCDEPTGALDEDKGKEVMNLLKEYSMNHLVIMITHNEELAYEYGDVILRLENKKLIREKEDHLKNNSKPKTKVRQSILKGLSIACLSFLQEKGKLIFALLACAFSLTAFLLMTSLGESSSAAIQEKMISYADYNRLNVTQLKSEKIENTSFSLSKTIKPDKEFIKDLVKEYGDVSPNLDYFFLNSRIIYNQKDVVMKIQTFPFSSGLNDIRINKQAKEVFDDLSLTVKIISSFVIPSTYQKRTVQDVVNFTIETRIHQVYDEFDFLNYPCIFISSDALSQYMKQTELKRFSALRGMSISLYDRFDSLCANDDPVSSYSYYIDVKRSEDVYKVYKELNGLELSSDTSLEVSSRSMSIRNTLYSNVTLLESIMQIFVFILIAITIVLLQMLVSSSFETRKKEFALYHTYGFSFFEFYIYILFPLSVLVLISMLYGLVLYNIGKRILGSLLFSFFELDIYSFGSISQSLLISFIFFIFLIMLSLCIYPAFKANKLKVSEVIKSE